MGYITPLLVAALLYSSLLTLPIYAVTIHYTHPDHLGSFRAITDEIGRPTTINEYSPYGQPSLNDSADDFQAQRQYAGYQIDQPTNLHYLGARYFDSVLGKFYQSILSIKIRQNSISAILNN
jgi:RHS repeat-associated protein